MANIADIQSFSNGARFYRADMHIHSYGAVRSASHDVKDSTMTPDAIVQTAISERLDVISITDHNEIGNLEAALAAARDDLLVIPGVELSTPQGHLLCYLPDLEALRSFYSRLPIADRGTQNSRCQTGISECLTTAYELGGFGVLAHIDAPKGYEIEVPGNAPHKVDVLCHPGLLGIELKSGISEIAYSDQDPNSHRAAIGNERINRLGLGTKQFLARVLFSDAHTLNALGRNAEGNRKVTRIKMGVPSFAALKLAFEDADARVRIEERIPYAVPYVLGAQMDGGFLDQQAIHFSRNLNCIVGGRGTGKSTTFEAIRCLSTEESANNNVVDSEVWPSGLSLFWQDAAGNQHSLFRPSQDALFNVDDPDLGPTSFPIDCYGQGETAKISQQARSNPYVLIQYLDKFVDKDAPAAAEEAAKAKLFEIQGKIESAESKVLQIPQYEKALQSTKQQLATIQKLAQEEAAFTKELATLKSLKTELAELRRTRISVLKERWSAREQIATIRDTYARKASKARLRARCCPADTRRNVLAHRPSSARPDHCRDADCPKIARGYREE